jgi:hypothetical protein
MLWISDDCRRRDRGQLFLSYNHLNIICSSPSKLVPILFHVRFPSGTAFHFPPQHGLYVHEPPRQYGAGFSFGWCREPFAKPTVC